MARTYEPAGSSSTGEGKASLTAQAYHALHQLVVNHRLPTGELLNEQWLCAKVGLGRTPVHLALQRLHQEEFIQIVPRKGILVKPDSISRIIDLLDARSIIEPVIARRAAERAVPSQIEALRQIALPQTAPTETSSSPVDRFIERDRAFHAKLAEIGGNPVLIELQKSLHERAMRFWHSNLSRTLDEGRAADEHAAVIDAVARGDGTSAAVAMSAHIDEITDRLRKLQAEVPGGNMAELVR
ncbi:MAG: GntR family transcriptional regulator [Alteraurantiacibacter sp.]